MRRLALSALLTLAACTAVDNSGGEPPPGTERGVERLDEPAMACSRYADQEAWLREAEDIEEWLDTCEPAATVDVLQQDLTAELAALAGDEALVGLDVALGGCLGPWELRGAFQEGSSLNLWMLKGDSSYGRADVACTADVGEAHAVYKVSGLDAGVDDLTLRVGYYNPDLPDGPDAQ